MDIKAWLHQSIVLILAKSSLRILIIALKTNELLFLTGMVSAGSQGDMKKIDDTLVVYRVLFLCLMMQLATIPQAVAMNSLAESMSLSSLLPLLATVYRSIPEAKSPLPDLNPPPQFVQHFQPLLPPLLPDPFPLSIRHAESGLSDLFQDSIGLKLDEEASLVFVPSEFPAVAKVSDMSDENWPQLIAAESVHNDTGGVRSVFRWANQRIPDLLTDDPLLRFLAFIHGAAFHVQDSHGQLLYIIQQSGKLLVISRAEAFLRFSQYHQSFLESLYPDVFGPSLPAGGGWHEWNRFIRKTPFHSGQTGSHENPGQGANNRPGVKRPANPEAGDNGRKEKSSRFETDAMNHSERSPEQTCDHDTASTEEDGRQKHINQQKVQAIYGYDPPESDDEIPIPLYATAFLNRNQQCLYCPVCCELITGDAKACTSFIPHSICIDCFNSMTEIKKSRIKKCSICRGKMHNRPFNYEDAAAAVMFQCPLGCNYQCSLALMKNHTREQHNAHNTFGECRICQNTASVPMKVHRESCLSSVRLDQREALFYERTRQKPIRLYGGKEGKAIIPVYKVPEEETYYCKISKIFYESITKKGHGLGTHRIVFFGNNSDPSYAFYIRFRFDEREGSFSFDIRTKEEHRRMALPVIFNGKGEKLTDKSFTLRGDSLCIMCGCEIRHDMITHPDPFPICISYLLFGRLYSRDNIRHSDNFPECIYVQIKLTPAGRKNIYSLNTTKTLQF